MILVIVDSQESQHAYVIRSFKGEARLRPFTADSVIKNEKENGDQQKRAHCQRHIEQIILPRMPRLREPFYKRCLLYLTPFSTQAIDVPGQSKILRGMPHIDALKSRIQVR